MSTGDTIVPDKQSAIAYDEQARTTHWFGPDVVFGLTYEFVKSGGSLLDLGIGSGLSSILFHKAGVRIYGLDGSSDILDVFTSKGFAAELKQHDLRVLPLPYADHFFDHVISVAVLNSFQDLTALFHDIARIIKEHGIFAFTVEDQKPGQENSYAINRVEVSEKAKDEMSVTLFRHRSEYIAHLLDQNGFLLLKELEFLAFKYPAEHRDVFFKAYVVRKKESKQEHA